MSQVIVMGASAGGISALKTVLSGLGNFSKSPIIIVIHIKETECGITHLFQKYIKIRVKEAEDKELIQSGFVYFAPPGYHLLIEEEGTFTLSMEEKVNFSRPSIDLLFETAAEAYSDQVIGILLTGANDDGARGMKRIEELGGTVIVQDPETAEYQNMPKSAIKMVPTCRVMNLDAIRAYIETVTRGDGNE